ncbi:MAG: hypothetical protein ACREKH_20675, partial [Candidatus Rokuibacteriota bacterium]
MLHVLALILVLMLPTGPLHGNARPKELDVAFHRPAPLINVPVPAAPLPAAPAGEGPAGPRRPERERPAPSIVAPEQIPDAP